MNLRKLKAYVDHLIQRWTYRQKFIFLAVVFILSAYTPAYWLFRSIDLFSIQNSLKVEGLDYEVQINNLAIDIAQHGILTTKVLLGSKQVDSLIETLEKRIKDTIRSISRQLSEVHEIEKSNMISGRLVKTPFQTNFPEVDNLWEDVLTAKTLQENLELHLRLLREIQFELLQVNFAFDTNLTSNSVSYLLTRALAVFIPQNVTMIAHIYMLNALQHSPFDQESIPGELLGYTSNLRNSLNRGQEEFQSALTQEPKPPESIMPLIFHAESNFDRIISTYKVFVYSLEREDSSAALELLSMFRGVMEESQQIVLNNIIHEQKYLNYFWAALVFLITLGTLHALFYSLFRVLSSHLLQLMQYVEEITKGHFDIKLNMNTSDSVGKIGLAISKMGTSLGSFVEQLTDAGSRLKDFGDTISRMAASQQQLINQQESHVAKLEESNLEMANKSNEMVYAMEGIIGKTNKILGQQKEKQELKGIQQNMGHLIHSSEDILKRLDELTKNVSQASNLVNLITKVSDEAHLLGLNASIEMLHTGEHHRIFAEITQSIKQFASTTVAATHAIRKIVDDMIMHVTNARTVTKKCVVKINSGLSRLILVSQQVGFIASEGEKQTLRFHEINRAMQNQVHAVHVIIQSISGLSQEALQNASLMKQLKDTIEKLEDNTGEFNKALNQFYSYQERLK